LDSDKRAFLFPPAHLTGVSIEANPITAVDTRTVAFVGAAPRHDTPSGAVQFYDSWPAFRAAQLGGPRGGRLWNDVAHAIHGFFLNGGGRCYLANIGLRGSVADGLAELAALDDVAVVAAPGCSEYDAYEALTHHCEVACDRIAILDGPPRLTPANRRAARGEPPADDEAKRWRMPPPAPRGVTALYAPWIYVADPEGPAGATVRVPPSGHVAGLWARLTAEQGVQRSPAGEALRGALSVADELDEQEVAALAANGVNVLRALPERGVVVWGARTLAADGPWRYVAVRRLLNMVGESLRRSVRWAVYESPGETLWLAVRVYVADFLDKLWRQGALLGATAGAAYFVRCDASTNPPAAIQAGELAFHVGLAVLRPGEFVTLIVRLSEAGGEVEERA